MKKIEERSEKFQRDSIADRAFVSLNGFQIWNFFILMRYMETKTDKATVLP